MFIPVTTTEQEMEITLEEIYISCCTGNTRLASVVVYRFEVAHHPHSDVKVLVVNTLNYSSITTNLFYSILLTNGSTHTHNIEGTLS